MGEHALTAPLAHEPCANCGDQRPANYCPICGQHKIEHRQSLRGLFADTVEDLTLTSELPRTLKALFFKPGFLTLEYSAGRIARYVPPVRLYLAASLQFFLIISLQSHFAPSTAKPSVNAPTSATAPATSPVVVTPAAPKASFGVKRTKGPSTGAIKISTPFRALNVKLDSASRHLAALPPGEGKKRIGDAMLQRTPTVLFLLLPIYALMLKVFFWRRRRYYTEHLVYALHTHAFTFVMLSMFAILPHGGVWHYLRLAVFYSMLLYHLLAMKRVYGQGWIWTTIKWLCIGTIYFTIGLMAILGALISAVLTA